jgi:hypothetical protein
MLELRRSGIVLPVMQMAMRRFGKKNDWWDWGVILLLVASATLILWAGVWVAHSHANAPTSTPTPKAAPQIGAEGATSRDGS